MVEAIAQVASETFWDEWRGSSARGVHKLVRVLNLVDFAGRSNLCTPRPQAAPAPQVVVPADNSLERESRDLL